MNLSSLLISLLVSSSMYECSAVRSGPVQESHLMVRIFHLFPTLDKSTRRYVKVVPTEHIAYHKVPLVWDEFRRASALSWLLSSDQHVAWQLVLSYWVWTFENVFYLNLDLVKLSSWWGPSPKLSHWQHPDSNSKVHGTEGLLERVSRTLGAHHRFDMLRCLVGFNWLLVGQMGHWYTAVHERALI